MLRIEAGEPVINGQSSEGVVEIYDGDKGLNLTVCIRGPNGEVYTIADGAHFMPWPTAGDSSVKSRMPFGFSIN